ncbi:MAG: hypothetical protein HY906_03055 [Deltaproteobacteria bacterium]|nr:hypothetical protein [Deltaproteobacteria bacterium]
MMQGVLRRWMLALPLGCCVVAASVPALAQHRASCAVRQVLARKQPGGIPPDLRFLEPQLSKAPFTAWKSFRRLSRTDLQMTRDEVKDMILVTGHKLRLTYLGLDGRYLRLRLSIVPKVIDQSQLRLRSGGTFLQIGLPYQDGTLIVAVTCKG